MQNFRNVSFHVLRLGLFVWIKCKSTAEQLLKSHELASR